MHTYAYLGIFLYFNNRHVFAFTIQGKDQLQLTRILQRSKSVRFKVNEFVYQGFGRSYESHNELFLLELAIPDWFFALTFYVKDFSVGFPDFESQFYFLQNHFLL